MTLIELVSRLCLCVSSGVLQNLHSIHHLSHDGPVEGFIGERARDRPYPVEILPAKPSHVSLSRHAI